MGRLGHEAIALDPEGKPEARQRIARQHQYPPGSRMMRGRT